MCLILVAWRVHPQFPCIVAANRDEFHARAAAPARWWEDRPQLLAGRDLSAGGTWLGVTRGGRFAALTNHRGAGVPLPSAPSRGTLVTQVLEAQTAVADGLRDLARDGARYNPFNLIFSDGARLGVYESVRAAGRELAAGIYGLSNDLLDTPWPKLLRAKSRLAAALTGLPDTAGILDLLRDDRPARDEDLPRTGVGLDWERLLSSAFIRSADYGTRCSTILRIDRRGDTWFDEWTWDAAGQDTGHVGLRFEIGGTRAGAAG
jgi:uncharacterized protein with NRDE domain